MNLPQCAIFMTAVERYGRTADSDEAETRTTIAGNSSDVRRETVSKASGSDVDWI
jgi:hypothetical protein